MSSARSSGSAGSSSFVSMSSGACVIGGMANASLRSRSPPASDSLTARVYHFVGSGAHPLVAVCALTPGRRPVPDLRSRTMSEKRHRQQQRRQRRKAQRRSRPLAGRSSLDRTAEPEMARLLTEMAKIASSDAHEPANALEAEQWASSMFGTWRVHQLPGEDINAIFFPGFVAALEKLASAEALATLRALSAVGAPDDARPARAAADRLAAVGLAEPR